MKKYLLLFIILSLLAFIPSSPGQTSQKSKDSSPVLTEPNLKAIQENFYNWWEKQEVLIQKKKSSNGDDDGIYNQFKRWEWLMESRTFPSGYLPDPAITARELTSYREKHAESSSRNATWSPVGTAEVPGNGGGAGRINVIQFDPITPTTMYLGAAGGGVWKSTNSGLDWIPIGDQLPVTSIADMAINPLNTDILYVATGDGYGYEITWQSDNDFWGGVYTAGILKSTDGGATWTPTGLSYLQENVEVVQRILIHPVNPDILLAATRGGLYRTTDAGDTWTMVDTAHCYDMAFNTSNSDIIYAGGNKDILQSTDAGATWTILADNLGGAGRISIETTPADPNVIYALFENGYKLKRSGNGGATWVNKNSPSNAASFYGYYDLVMAVSPSNPDVLLAGGLLVGKSENGGQSWQSISNWSPYTASDYVHADNHSLAFDPVGEETIYSGNDGGLFKSVNLGDTWSDLSNGLSIAQIYRFSTSATNPEIITSGWQDNGSNIWNGTTWKQIYYADGMETIIDYTDPNIIYVESQGGGLNKSTNGGLTFQYIAPSGGAWVTPYVMDPEDHEVLYYGSSAIYKTTNGGNNWTNTGNIFSDLCFSLAVAPSNTDYVYAASLDKIYLTTSGGGAWTDVTTNLPSGQAGINYIAISNTDPENVWVAMSGYVAGEKVYHSSDGGGSWTNVSGSLPNIPVNSIVYENDSPDGLYIGTDIGVFYLDNTLADWVFYNAGLPNVMVHELEINYTANKLYAATYGRGIWESDLYYTVQYTNDIGTLTIYDPDNEVCSSTVEPEVKVKNFGTNTVTSFDVNYSIDGGTLYNYNWSGSLTALSSVTILLPGITGVLPGPHTFEVFTSDPNGNSDNNLVNDNNSSEFVAVGTGTSLPFEEGFESGIFPPTGWQITNQYEMWLLSSAAGAYGNSANSAMVDFYHTPQGTDYLLSPYLNFSNSIPPIKLKFSVAYAKKNANKADTLKIGVSTDCGESYTNVYVKGGTDLATAPDLQGSIFIPTAVQWKDEIVELAGYGGYDKVLIRFAAVSDHGNQMFLDDINLYGLSTGILSSTVDDPITLHPNPTAGAVIITLHEEQAGEVIIEIIDLLGQEVRQINMQDGMAHQTYDLDLSGEQNGVYLVKIKTNSRTLVKQLILQQ